MYAQNTTSAVTEGCYWIYNNNIMQIMLSTFVITERNGVTGAEYGGRLLVNNVIAGKEVKYGSDGN